MKFSTAAMLLATSVALVGCAGKPPLQRSQTAAISRDTSAQDLDRILSTADEAARVEFEANGQRFAARSFNLQTGTRTEMMVVCTPNCMPIMTPVSVTTPYVVIESLPARKLHAWGTVEELSKDADNAVSSLMPVVKQKLAEAQKAK